VNKQIRCPDAEEIWTAYISYYLVLFLPFVETVIISCGLGLSQGNR